MNVNSGKWLPYNYFCHLNKRYSAQYVTCHEEKQLMHSKFYQEKCICYE